MWKCSNGTTASSVPTSFTNRGEPIKCSQLQALVDDYGITHVVFKSKEIPLACDFAEEIVRIENFVIYAIRPQ